MGFSKQYVEKYLFEEVEWDFDIEKEAAELEEDEWREEFCAGFCSIGYGKRNGKIMVVFEDIYDFHCSWWVALEDVTDQTYIEVLRSHLPNVPNIPVSKRLSNFLKELLGDSRRVTIHKEPKGFSIYRVE